MSTTAHKAFLQRRTSTAAERKAYRERRRKAFKELITLEYAKFIADREAKAKCEAKE